ncbi:wax ester/triacylglycerol synthase domain-containing protein [Nocardia altamirensis]|uniref:wax ester/triacylglycerol synthase domain-containing protein n=1 Tax=Nocardia altamirensis TaxID=472158 RepID=UPI000B218108|nr:wax ester/triacylglycerol synthase domain-containing protein [Nocardia altamirensis]
MKGSSSGRDRLTELDCVHLRLDSVGHPMHWMLGLSLEPGEPITIEQLRARVAMRVREHEMYRLCLPERLRRRPAFVHADAAEPHTRVQRAVVADRGALLRAVEELMATPMSRTAPLWDVTLVDEEDRGSQTVLLRVHHCLSDGVAAPGFAALVVDGEGVGDHARFVTAPRFPFKRALTWRTCVEMPRQYCAARPVRRGGRMAPFPPADCVRAVAEFSIPIRRLRQGAASAAGSSTEYLLAAAAEAYRQVTARATTDGLRIMVPVTLDSELRHTGNATASAFLDVDTSGARMTDRVAAVRERMAAIDPVDQARALASASVDLQYLPWRGQTWLMARMVRDTCQLSVSITPGFTLRYSVFGRAVHMTLPLSPLMADELMVTALMLRDQLAVGVVADPRVLPCAVGDFAEYLRELLLDAAEGSRATD